MMNGNSYVMSQIDDAHLRRITNNVHVNVSEQRCISIILLGPVY